jgi:hypothetical protein
MENFKMAESKTYRGSCHCGKIRYEVATDLAGVIECNCSMCQRKGTLLNFVPMAQFKLIAGEGLVDYQFNKHVIHHLFCSTCGVTSFCRGVGRDGGEMAAINVRCLEGVELGEVSVMKFDGRSQ